jgi:DNA polymerase-3 subunit alpha
MCQGSGHTLDNPDRPTMINWDYSFKTEEEMQADFGYIPEALSNTLKINDAINIEFTTGWVLIPKYDLPDDDQKIYDDALNLEKDEKELKLLTSDEWYLRYLCFEGLNWRYDYWIPREHVLEFVKKLDKPSLDKKLQETSPEELKDLSLTYYTDKKKELLSSYNDDVNAKIERLEYELVVVHEMWFDAYFLIVADYINRARDHDIPVWPWRWSAAWALLAYLSWITDIDPLKYDLLFERFLNPARVSMPDIDTDFSDDARSKVIDYCRRKYWADHVAQICTFGTFAARAAVKDVWRTHGLPFQEMNALAAQIPEKPGTKLKKALEESPEFKQSYDTNEKYREIIDQALAIEWNVRQLW